MSKKIIKTPIAKYYGGKFNMLKFLLQYEILEKEGWGKSYYFRRVRASLKSRPVVKEVVWWNKNLDEKLKSGGGKE
jgi:hypothetical protein